LSSHCSLALLLQPALRKLKKVKFKSVKFFLVSSSGLETKKKQFSGVREAVGIIAENEA
jgi:hypothetical protein